MWQLLAEAEQQFDWKTGTVLGSALGAVITVLTLLLKFMRDERDNQTKEREAERAHRESMAAKFNDTVSECTDRMHTSLNEERELRRKMMDTFKCANYKPVS